MCKQVHWRFASKNVQIHRRVQEKRLEHLGHQSGSCLRAECAYNECNQQRSLNRGGLVGTLKREVGLSLVPTSSYQYFPRSFLSSCFMLSFPLKSHALYYKSPSYFSPRGLNPSFLPEAFGAPTPTPSLAVQSNTPFNAWHPLFPPVFCCFGPVLTPQLGHKFSPLCFQVSFLSSKKDVDNKNWARWNLQSLAPSLACSQNWIPSCVQQILANRAVKFLTDQWLQRSGHSSVPLLLRPGNQGQLPNSQVSFR